MEYNLAKVGVAGSNPVSRFFYFSETCMVALSGRIYETDQKALSEYCISDRPFLFLLRVEKVRVGNYNGKE